MFIKNLRVFLNTEVFPYTNMNLDFAKNKYGLAFQSYLDFQKSYYGREISSVPLSYKAFAEEHAIFVVDCSKQNERVKFGGIDIRLEVQTASDKPIPARTSCHCLILHDKIVEYTPLSNIVRKL